MMARRSDGVFTMPVEEVRERVAEAKRLVKKIRGMFPRLVTLEIDERVHSTGRLKPGEPDALRAVLDAAEAHREHFEPPASHRFKGAHRFDVGPARDDLARREALAELATELDLLAMTLDDTVLVLGARVRDVAHPILALAKVVAETDPELRARLAPAARYFETHAKQPVVKTWTAPRDEKP